MKSRLKGPRTPSFLFFSSSSSFFFFERIKLQHLHFLLLSVLFYLHLFNAMFIQLLHKIPKRQHKEKENLEAEAGDDMHRQRLEEVHGFEEVYRLEQLPEAE